MALSFVELGTHRTHHFRTVPIPPEYTALEQETPTGILAEYPLGYSDIYRLWQRLHDTARQRRTEGSVADQAHESYLMVLDPKEPGDRLRAVAARRHRDRAASGRPRGRSGSAARTCGRRRLRLIGRFPDASSVWTVLAPPAPAFVLLSGGFALPRRLDSGVIGYPLIASGGVAVIELRAHAHRESSASNSTRPRPEANIS